jgi:VWFA-related protein
MTSAPEAMRRIVVVLVAALATAPVVLGQTPQAPVFRGGVTLVTVDVSVLDRNGKPVPGLTADDFEIKLDGHVQPVRTAAYEQVALEPAGAAGAPPAPQALPARETTNATPVPELRLFVVMLDDLSITPSRGKDMFFAAGRFVDALPLSDVVGFTTTSGTATLNPTRNRQAVDAVLRHTAGEFIDSRMSGPPVGIQEALDVWAGDATTLKQIILRDCFQGAQAPSPSAIANSYCAEQVERKARMLGSSSRMTAARQLQAYVNVINAMKAAPGLKQLVIVSDGLGVASREQQMDFQPVARAAAEAGVHLSVLEQEPDLTSVEDRSSLDNQVRRADNLALTEGLITMTEETGGDFYRVIGLPDPAFQRVTIATSGVYHLGVEAPPGSAPGRNFTLAARVKRSAITVHANRVAVLATPATPVTVDEQLQAAVAKGLPNYGVPVSVATVIRRGDDSTQVDVDANLEVPAGTPGPLIVMFGLLDAGGTLRTGRKTVEAPESGGSYHVSLALPVSPGGYRLRLGVADASGHVGSIDAPVTAELDRVGPFLTSDVMTSWSGSDGKPRFLALEDVPAAATGLHTLLELYPASDAALPADVRVQWSVIGSGLQPAAEQSAAPVRTTDRLTAAGQFTLESLTPGTYEIRATILVDGHAVGTVSTTFRKSDKGGLKLTPGRLAAAVRR